MLLRNRTSGKLAVVIINWGAPVATTMPVRVRCGAGGPTGARCLALHSELAAHYEGDALVLSLPGLGDGDILLLE